MLSAVDPKQLPKDPVTKEPLKDALTVVQVMEAAIKTLDAGSLKDQPLVEAQNSRHHRKPHAVRAGPLRRR